MVKLGDRAQSTNIIDKRGVGGGSSGRTGSMIALGFAGTAGAGIAGLAMSSVNTLFDWIGLTPPFEPPALTEERQVELDRFMGVILGDTERVWELEFGERGETYTPATLVLYDNASTSECGEISAKAGPVYCAFDQRIYLDLSFVNEIEAKFGAPGDFPPAFMLSHEVGHHIQNLNGVLDRFFEAFDDPNANINQMQVRLELNADCLAGVWTNRAQRQFDLLDDGDLQEGIRAAQLFGDDTIQELERGYVNEASFTHGSGEQRARWFQTGFVSGDSSACDTFTDAYEDL